MISLLLMAFTLIFNPLSADARTPIKPVTKGLNFEGCNSESPYAANTPKIDDQGFLIYDPSDKNLISHDKKGKTEVLKVFSPFNMPGQRKKEVITYTLDKENGIPKTLSTAYKIHNRLKRDEDGRFAPSYYAMNHYGYKDGNCFINQVSSKLGADGKETISYDRGLCDKVLKSAKKVGMRKMQQCVDELVNIREAVQEFSKKAEEAGKSFGSFYGSQDDSEKKPYSAWTGVDPNFSSLLTIGNCHMVRSGFPKDSYDPDTVLGNVGFATPFKGGGIVPAGQGFKNSFGTAYGTDGKVQSGE